MRRVLALAGLGLAALILQSVATAVLPVRFVPDLALLLAIAAAVSAAPIEGMLLATGVGYGADLLSGALLGQQALLRLAAFGVTRAVSGQFHLKRGLPLAICVASMTVADAAGTAGIGWLFASDPWLGLHDPLALATRAVVNALVAPFAVGLLDAVLELLTEREARRRDVRLETRRPVL
jgi:rod shape-determining protein MreD